MDLAVVNMEIESAMRCQYAVCLPQARLQKGEVIVESVGVFTS